MALRASLCHPDRMLALLLAALPYAPFTPTPDDWNIDRLAWSPDGQWVALCGERGVALAGLDGSVMAVLRTEHACEDVAFGPDGLWIGLSVPHGGSHLHRWRGGVLEPQAAPQPVRALLLRGSDLWVATDAGVRRGDDFVALPGVRRLAPGPGGVLAVQASEAVVLDGRLEVTDHLRPPAIAVNGLTDGTLDARSGVTVLADAQGSLWSFRADGRLLGQHIQASRGRQVSTFPQGFRVVVGDDHFSLPELVPQARRRRAVGAQGPVAVGPRALATVVPGGVRFDALELPAPLQPRGLPAPGRSLVLAGNRLAATTDEGTVVTFDLETGQVVRVVEASRDGLRLLIGDPAGTLYAGSEWGAVLAITPEGAVQRFSMPGAGVRGLVRTAAGTLVVGATYGVYHLDPRTGTHTTLLESTDQHDFQVALTPEGDVLATSYRASWRLSLDGTRREALPIDGGAAVAGGQLWSARGRKVAVHTWPQQALVAQHDVFAPDQYTFLPGGDAIGWGWSGPVVRLSPKAGQRWMAYAPWHVGGLVYDPQRKVLWSTGPDATISRWNPADGQRISFIPPDGGLAVAHLAFAPDGRLVAGDEKGGVWVWHTDGRLDQRWTHPDFPELYGVPTATGVLALTEDGRGVRFTAGKAAGEVLPDSPLVSGLGGTLVVGTRHAVRLRGAEGELLALPEGRIVRRLAGLEGAEEVAMSADERRLVVHLQDAQEVVVVDLESGKILNRSAFSSVWALAWDGVDVLVGTEDGLRRWTPGKAPGPVLTALTGPTLLPRPGGFLLADGSAFYLLGPDLQLQGAAMGEADGTRVVALSADGQQVATTGRTGRILVWDLATRRPRLRLVGHADGFWESEAADGTRHSGQARAHPRYHSPSKK